MENRLQFRHHGIGSGYTDGVFATRDEAINYIKNDIRWTDEGLAAVDSTQGLSLFAEPTVLRYKNEEDETNPHLILAIGAVSNNSGQYQDNRFCIIDIDKTEKEIEDLGDLIDDVEKSLTIIAKASDTLTLHAEETEDGTILSGDVKMAPSYIFDDVKRPNILMTTADGLFTYVNLEYKDDKLTFTVNGDVKEWDLRENSVIEGYYSNKDESLHLVKKDGEEVVVSLDKLIAEWGVEGEASNTPIVLTKEEVGYGNASFHNHVEPWQDILKADVRILERAHNILEKSKDGRYLYVDGSADNIFYKHSGDSEISVAKALDKALDTRLSIDSKNILWDGPDGFFASSSLEYVSNENKLVFKTSNVTGGTDVKEIQLNAVEAFKDVYYDTTKEALIITYIDSNGNFGKQEINIGDMLRDWEWDVQNDGHNVLLVKNRVVNGNDKVSADVQIFKDGPNNILQDLGHMLYVKGTADNIVYGDGSTVKAALDDLADSFADLEEDVVADGKEIEQLKTVLRNEINRSTAKDTELENAINNEVNRSTAKDAEHDSEIARVETKFDEALGDGFDAHDTVRDAINDEAEARKAADEALSDRIDAISADTSARIKSISNVDHSINVDNTDAVNPTISVNLSTQTVNVDGADPLPNIIELENDGLFATVDLSYVYDSETGKNQLVFRRNDFVKVIDIQLATSIDRVYYDAETESIIVMYTVNGVQSTASIPMSALIREWTVSDSTIGAIKLTKQEVGSNGPDILSAEVVIADSHDDNILVNDKGALYVSNSGITKNASDISALQTRADAIEATVQAVDEKADSIATDLQAEVTRAVSAETELRTSVTNAQNNIDKEIARATAKEAELDERITALDDEIDADKETFSGSIHDLQTQVATLETNLSNEIQRSVEKDQAHDTSISALTGNVSTLSAHTATTSQKLDDEIERATNADTALQNAVSSLTQTVVDNNAALGQRIGVVETNVGTLSENLNNEIERSKAIDEELKTQVQANTSNIASLQTEDTRLSGVIDNEVTRAKGEEAKLQTNIENEQARATNAEAALQSAIDAERNERITKDGELQQAIADATLTFSDSTTVRLTKDDSNNVIGELKIATGDNNIITKDSSNEGVFASVSLKYDGATNKLSLVTSAGEQEGVQLSAGSIIKEIRYDNDSKTLIIAYEDAQHQEHEVSVPVADLFNEWIVSNPAENSAIELTKTQDSTEGGADLLSARVILSAIDDNMIRFDSNGLYVPGTGLTQAVEDMECLEGRVAAFEKAMIGHNITQQCGEGYVYEPYVDGQFISSATSMQHAAQLLDAAMGSAFTEIHENSGNTADLEEELNAVKNELKITHDNVMGIVIPDGGMGADGTAFKYQPNSSAHYISAATSMNDADTKLDNAIFNNSQAIEDINDRLDGNDTASACTDNRLKVFENTVLGQTLPQCGEGYTYRPTGSVISGSTSFMETDERLNAAVESLQDSFEQLLMGSKTPTITLSVSQEGLNRYLEGVVRLSHGNRANNDQNMQTDAELTIADEDSPELTDTNVLSIVDTTAKGYNDDISYNGLYLSNVWDCGLYTIGGEGTPYNKYMTDDTVNGQAKNYNNYNRR